MSCHDDIRSYLHSEIAHHGALLRCWLRQAVCSSRCVSTGSSSGVTTATQSSLFSARLQVNDQPKPLKRHSCKLDGWRAQQIALQLLHPNLQLAHCQNARRHPLAGFGSSCAPPAAPPSSWHSAELCPRWRVLSPSIAESSPHKRTAASHQHRPRYGAQPDWLLHVFSQSVDTSISSLLSF